MNHHLLIILHLSCAAIWVGGHLLLLLRYVPQAIKDQDVQLILNFEKKYEPLGLPALLILVITGILLAYQYGIPISSWFSFSNPIEKIVSLKLLLLLCTLILAVHARWFVIPKLTVKNLIPMVWHIFFVTAMGLAMLIVGSSVRFGGI